MKKLLFLASFSFLFVQLAQAIVLPQVDFSAETIFSESTTTATTQIQVTFGSGGDLSNLDLINSQQLSFKNASGVIVLVDLQVQSEMSIGTSLNVVFDTASNLSGLTADISQKLNFVHASTGVATTVDFIVIDTIIH